MICSCEDRYPLTALHNDRHRPVFVLRLLASSSKQETIWLAGHCRHDKKQLLHLSRLPVPPSVDSGYCQPCSRPHHTSVPFPLQASYAVITMSLQRQAGKVTWCPQPVPPAAFPASKSTAAPSMNACCTRSLQSATGQNIIDPRHRSREWPGLSRYLDVTTSIH